jgi:hypothetical protein
MTFERRLASALSMDDATWIRHVNPWSGMNSRNLCVAKSESGDRKPAEANFASRSAVCSIQ